MSQIGINQLAKFDHEFPSFQVLYMNEKYNVHE